jgi:hypothetical protein
MFTPALTSGIQTAWARRLQPAAGRVGGDRKGCPGTDCWSAPCAAARRRSKANRSAINKVRSAGSTDGILPNAFCQTRLPDKEKPATREAAGHATSSP